ncbi:MAG: hypothetical protein SNH73_07555 [Rikenellaceae bacterium]
MLTINPTLYEQLALLLIDDIGSMDYYSGTITIEQEEADYSFEASLIIRYNEVKFPEGYDTQISELIPVWWEMHSVTDEGEQLNDFDFNILRRAICN